jgi:hypothetical protein
MLQFAEQHGAVFLFVIQTKTFHEVFSISFVLGILDLGENWQELFDFVELLL